MRLFFTICFLIDFLSINAQVHLQTGAAQQSFPLINYNDAKAGITLNVGLNYSSGNGLLVNNIASNVGTGWDLEAGGAVVRIQSGEPDDQAQRYTGFFWYDVNDPNKNDVFKNYPDGYLYNPNTGAKCNVGLNYYPVFKKQSVYKELNKVAADMEQDRFVFSMNGHSGVFIIGKDWVAKTLGDSKIRIAIDTMDMTGQGIRTRIYKFTLTTEEGVKYTFGNTAVNDVLRYKNAIIENGKWVPQQGSGSSEPKAVTRMWGFELGNNEHSKVINSWFLSEMENLNTREKVTFSYQDIRNDIITSKVITHQRDLNNSRNVMPVNENKYQTENGRWFYDYLVKNNYKEAQLHSIDLSKLDKLVPGPTTLMYVRSLLTTKRVTRIDLPNGGKIQFVYHTHSRVDLVNENALSRVDYFSKTKFIRSYEMDYGYFFQSSMRSYMHQFTSSEKKYARLCLLSIRKIGDGRDEVSEPPYLFDYYKFNVSQENKDDYIPPQSSLSQDHWGYYNGSNSELEPQADHDWLPDERNQYYKTVLYIKKAPKSGYAKNGLLREIKYPTGGSLTYEYAQNLSLFGLYNVTSGGVSVSRTIEFDGEDKLKNIITLYNYKNNANRSTRWGYEEPTYYNFSVTEYNQKWGGKKFKYPGYLFPEMATSVDWSKVITKAMISSGVGMGIHIAIQMLPAAAIPIVNAMVFAASMIKFIFDAITTSESHRYILTNVNNKLGNPLPEQYSAVEVQTNSPTGYNGKTIIQFTSPAHTPILISSQEWPYVPAQRLLNWAYGLPKTITVYDKDNVVVNETLNIYESKNYKIQNNQNINCKCATYNRRSISAFDWDEYKEANYSVNQVHWMVPRPYFFYTGRTDLVSTSERNFKNASLYYSNTVKYIIDPVALIQKGKIIEKDKNVLVKEVTYFPSDFDFDGSLQLLRARNVIQVPVSRETWITKVSTGPNPIASDFLIDASITEFKTFTFSDGISSRNEVKPWKMYKLKSIDPLPASVIGLHNRISRLLRTPQFFRLEKELIYDVRGNLVETTENDLHTSFINDYNERQVTATTVNASYSDIAHTSFEADGKGGFTFDNAGITLNSGVTGNKCFLLNPSRLVVKSGLNASETYVVSYWRKDIGSTGISILGIPGELLFEGPDNWKLYQHEISGYSTISIQGSAFIDEVKIYPKGAMMNTSTFEEGVGKTSDADINNRLTFYEYDALGRLKLVRDEKKNVIKTYEYNFVK